MSNPLNAPAVSQVAASVQGNQEVVFDGTSVQTTVSGITANYLAVNNLEEFQAGDGITRNDVDTKARGRAGRGDHRRPVRRRKSRW